MFENCVQNICVYACVWLVLGNRLHLCLLQGVDKWYTIFKPNPSAINNRHFWYSQATHGRIVYLVYYVSGGVYHSLLKSVQNGNIWRNTQECVIKLPVYIHVNSYINEVPSDSGNWFEPFTQMQYSQNIVLMIDLSTKYIKCLSGCR